MVLTNINRCLVLAVGLSSAAAAEQAQQWVFHVDRTLQGLPEATYTVEVSHLPNSVSSWCEGEHLYSLPFCGGKKEDDASNPIVKQVQFAEEGVKVTGIAQYQEGNLLRSHQIAYNDQHKRLKARIKTKSKEGAVTANSNIIADGPIELVTIESLMVSQLDNVHLADNLHWIEPKRSKRMNWQELSLDIPDSELAQAEKGFVANHFNPHNAEQVPMFRLYFDKNGEPLAIYANSGKWKLYRINPNEEKSSQ